MDHAQKIPKHSYYQLFLVSFYGTRRRICLRVLGFSYVFPNFLRFRIFVCFKIRPRHVSSFCFQILWYKYVGDYFVWYWYISRGSIESQVELIVISDTKELFRSCKCKHVFSVPCHQRVLFWYRVETVINMEMIYKCHISVVSS